MKLIHTWRGKRIEDCSREEMLEAIRALAAELERSRKALIAVSEIRDLADVVRRVLEKR